MSQSRLLLTVATFVAMSWRSSANAKYGTCPGHTTAFQQKIDTALNKIKACLQKGDCRDNPALAQVLKFVEPQSGIVDPTPLILICEVKGEIYVDKTDVKKGTSTDGKGTNLAKIYWNPDDATPYSQRVPPYTRCVTNDPTAALAHELIHARYMSVGQALKLINNPAPGVHPDPEQVRAIAVSNIYRRCAGICQLQEDYAETSVSVGSVYVLNSSNYPMCDCDPVGVNGPQQCSSADKACCNQKCIDVAYDPNNCGSCGYPCKPGQICANRICQCAGYPDSDWCGDIQRCTNLKSDPKHCNSCINSCPDINGGAYPLCCNGSCCK